MMNNKYIFVTGVSESGKSYACDYLQKKYKFIIHLKIRDIIKKMTKEDDTTKEFWAEFIHEVDKIVGRNKIVIMDTLRKITSFRILANDLEQNINFIYIEADLDKRLIREYKKKIKNNEKIEIEELKSIILKKDFEKIENGLYEIKSELKIENIINNNNTLIEFEQKLNDLVLNILNEDL